MTPVDEELSAAVVAYYSRGRKPFPSVDTEAAAACATTRSGPELVALVEAIVGDAERAPIDWATTSLDDAGRLVGARALAAHPELSDHAAGTIGWAFTYFNR